jgi:hypothetical protein
VSSSATASPPFPRDRRFILQFAALFAVAIGAIAIIIYGVFGTDDASIGEPPEGVESYEPVQDSFVTSQITIRVNLADEYTGALFIDGLEIPLDQIATQADNIGILEYRPGQDTATGELQPGRHRASVEFWRATDPRGTSRSFRWTFTVTA